MVDALSATIPIKELPIRGGYQKMKRKETFLEGYLYNGSEAER